VLLDELVAGALEIAIKRLEVLGVEVVNAPSATWRIVSLVRKEKKKRMGKGKGLVTRHAAFVRLWRSGPLRDLDACDYGFWCFFWRRSQRSGRKGWA
jgi:hypothetical protein